MEHGVNQALLFAVAGIERGEGVGEAGEVGAAVLLGLEQGAQGVGAPALLEEHGGVDAVQGGGLMPSAEQVGKVGQRSVKVRRDPDHAVGAAWLATKPPGMGKRPVYRLLSFESLVKALHRLFQRQGN